MSTGVRKTLVPLKKPVEITWQVAGNRIYLNFPQSDAVSETIRVGFDNPNFDRSYNLWTVRDCPRNRYILEDAWPKSERHQRYFTEPPKNSYGKYPLWSNQKQAADAFLFRKRFFYAGKQGTGKFLIAAAAIDKLITDKQLKHSDQIWWVASNAGLKGFEQQYQQWNPVFYPNVLCTYSGVTREIERASIPPRVLVLDELAACKNAAAQQTQSVLALSELMESYWGDNCYILGLTGTPRPLSHLDWWAQCEIVRPGFLREASSFYFRDRYANVVTTSVEIKSEDEDRPDEMEVMMGEHPDRERKPVRTRKFLTVQSWKEDEIAKFPARLAGLVMRHDERDLPIEINTKEYVLHRIEPTKKDLKIAEMLAAQATNTLGALQKLAQFADGFQYLDNPDGDGRAIKYGKTPKDDILRQLLVSCKQTSQRIIIYCAYTAALDKAVQICIENGYGVLRADGRGWHGFGCPASIEAFQNTLDHSYPMAFVAHTKTGGESVTLTAADDMLFYSNTYNQKDRDQAEMRLRYKKCKIHDIIYMPTDEKVLTNLRMKEDGSKLTLAQIRELCKVKDD